MPNRSSPVTDALLIDAALLLDYNKLSLETYASIGVKEHQVKLEPYHRWLGAVLREEIETTSELQVARDGRLVNKLFNFARRDVREGSALDIVHLFVEARGRVYVYSHETPDALEGIAARAGLPARVERLPLVDRERLHEVVSSILQSELAPSWLAVYGYKLSQREQEQVLAVQAGRGIVVNVHGSASRTGTSDDAVLKIIEERWCR